MRVLWLLCFNKFVLRWSLLNDSTDLCMHVFLTKKFVLLVTVNFNSFTSYAYMYYQHLKEQTLSGLRWPHCMPSFHGSLWDISLNLHWFVYYTCFFFFLSLMESMIFDLLTKHENICFVYEKNELLFGFFCIELVMKF